MNRRQADWIEGFRAGIMGDCGNPEGLSQKARDAREDGWAVGHALANVEDATGLTVRDKLKQMRGPLFYRRPF